MYKRQSATSAELGYTPSGVSYIIDTVEKELGFNVINRTQTGICLLYTSASSKPLMTVKVQLSLSLITATC